MGRLNVRTGNDKLGGAAVKSNVPADSDNDVVCLRPAFRVVVNRLRALHLQSLQAAHTESRSKQRARPGVLAPTEN